MTAATPSRDDTPAVDIRAGHLFDRVLGYDFFISYAHADSPGYAEQLDSALGRAGFKAFLDKQVYVAGDDLNTATLRRVRASSKLVVIVGPAALQSHWVLQEVEAALAAQRPVIAIDLLGGLADGPAAANPLAARLRDIIHIRETGGLQADVPSDATLQALARSFQSTRREALRWRLALAGVAFFAVLAGFSYWQKTLADARAEQYLKFCEEIRTAVRTGNATIGSLRGTEFGDLVADVTETLARLPDPDTDPKLRCVPVGSDEPARSS